ncbi:testis-specific serine/threonine-protein kinase 3-like [Pollicipes pollicipes]|uniref:testis-specific serine/threonine-protein kinase 3-like n=1 Tax=Pollicipes pollicipes TaxID=41117 RepID=UPI001884F8F4|nr:testis-specific serine/threonine-protein kinase 3-like [Pollicipes pollicipes]
MADSPRSSWDGEAAAVKRLDAPFRLRMKGDGAFRPDRRRRDIIQQEGITLFETIAEGSFSKIHRAFFKREHKEVVVKVIPKRRAPPEYYERFLPREIATLRLTQEHPLVVDLYAALEGPAAYYLVMEHCERGDLLDYVNKMGFLAEVEARAFFRQMVDAVQYLHHMGIIHRDIKLENMLLNADYEIRIADFGFARFHGERLSETKCGSFVYTAPEIFLGHPYNGLRADMWSLGVCLYAMVCGRLPLAQTRADLRDPHALLTAAHRKLHFTKQVTSGCRQVTRQLMSTAPQQRPTATELKRCQWMGQPLHTHGAGQRQALQRKTSSSMVMLSSEVVMKAAQSRSALTLQSDMRMLKHSTAGQAARAAKQDARSAKKKGSAKYTSAKMRWKAAVLAMKRQRFNRWRDLCQKLGKMPHMRIEDAEQELDMEQNFDFSQF